MTASIQNALQMRKQMRLKTPVHIQRNIKEITIAALAPAVAKKPIMALFSFALRDDRDVGDEVGLSDAMSYYSVAVICLCKLYPLTVMSVFFGVDVRAKFVLLSLNVYAVYFILRYMSVSLIRYYYLSAAGLVFIWGLSSLYTVTGMSLNTPMACVMIGLTHLSLTCVYNVYPKKGLYFTQVLLLLAIPYNDPMAIGADETYRRLFLLNLVWFTEIFIGKFVCRDEKVRLHYLFMMCAPILRLGQVLCYLYVCAVLSFRVYYIRKHQDSTKASLCKLFDAWQTGQGGVYKYEGIATEETQGEDIEKIGEEEKDGSVEPHAEVPLAPDIKIGPGTPSTAPSPAPAHFTKGMGGRASSTSASSMAAPSIPPSSSSSGHVPNGAHTATKSTTNPTAASTQMAMNTRPGSTGVMRMPSSLSAYDALKRSILSNPNRPPMGPMSEEKRNVTFAPSLEHHFEETNSTVEMPTEPKKIVIASLKNYY